MKITYGTFISNDEAFEACFINDNQDHLNWLWKEYTSIEERPFEFFDAGLGWNNWVLRTKYKEQFISWYLEIMKNFNEEED